MSFFTPSMTAPSSAAFLSSMMVTAVTFATSAGAQSQSRTWPVPYQNQQGEGAMSAPFTTTNTHLRRTARSTTVYDARSVPFGAGSSIEGIAFRRDAQDPASYPAFNGTATLRIGPALSAEAPYANTRHVFDGLPSQLFRGTVQAPASPQPSGSSTAPFNFTITFDRPWTYPGGDFAIDIHFQGPPSAVWRRDAVEIEQGQDGRFRTRGGMGLEGPGGFAPHIWTEPDQAVPGGALIFHLFQAPEIRPGGFAINLLGTGATQIGGVPLPVALPSSVFPAGADLRTEILAFQPAFTGDFAEEFARGKVIWPIETSTSLIGVSFASQWWVVDLALSNTIPVLTSDAIEVEIGTAATTTNIHYGRTMWSYGGREDTNLGHELGVRNYVPVTRFLGTFQ